MTTSTKAFFTKAFFIYGIILCVVACAVWTADRLVLGSILLAGEPDGMVSSTDKVWTPEEPVGWSTSPLAKAWAAKIAEEQGDLRVRVDIEILATQTAQGVTKRITRFSVPEGWVVIYEGESGCTSVVVSDTRHSWNP